MGTAVSPETPVAICETTQCRIPADCNFVIYCPEKQESHVITIVPINQKEIHYNLGNPTYIGPRYRWITKNDGLLEKVGTNLLIYTAQHRSFRIYYHLFILHTYMCIANFCPLIKYLGPLSVFVTKQYSLIFPDIIYRSTSNTILFSQINKFFTFVKFLNYFYFNT
jgi:hypothetical protein